MAKLNEFAARLARIKEHERTARPYRPNWTGPARGFDPELALPIGKAASPEPFGLLINFRLALAGMASIGLALYALSPANEPKEIIVLAHSDIAQGENFLGVEENSRLIIHSSDRARELSPNSEVSFVREILAGHAKRQSAADRSAQIADGIGAKVPPSGTKASENETRFSNKELAP